MTLFLYESLDSDFIFSIYSFQARNGFAVIVMQYCWKTLDEKLFGLLRHNKHAIINDISALLRKALTCPFIDVKLYSRHVVIRRSVTKPVFQPLVVSMVFTLLECGSASLAGPPNALGRLQSVLHATEH